MNREMFTLGVRIDNMIYAADFYSNQNLKSADFRVGDRIQAAVEHGKMTVRGHNGKTATAIVLLGAGFG